jgi:hypothetical protein
MPAKKKKKRNRFAGTNIAPIVLNKRERERGWRHTPSMVRCSKDGCRVLVKRPVGGDRRVKPRCVDHVIKYNGHGRLTAEDHRLLALSKDEL